MICLVSEGPMMTALKITSLKRLMHQSQWFNPSTLFNQATTTLFNLDPFIYPCFEVVFRHHTEIFSFKLSWTNSLTIHMTWTLLGVYWGQWLITSPHDYSFTRLKLRALMDSMTFWFHLIHGIVLIFHHFRPAQLWG